MEIRSFVFYTFWNTFTRKSTTDNKHVIVHHNFLLVCTTISFTIFILIVWIRDEADSSRLIIHAALQ